MKPGGEPQREGAAARFLAGASRLRAIIFKAVHVASHGGACKNGSATYLEAEPPSRAASTVVKIHRGEMK